ncbi:efflux RND transporter periplasmic adaptor subunit [Alginatibacterium sediminis]|uniref:Efflux RND transporter periplasmic adaptor subunit n=1 Tax=Alginatibacterium sediminis TaxID=2164068 RepID=A0A420E7H8_9ALTE|nr:efflux RND transporter periplasmic adaptor subunit [Alginatibacterium sediminis]RKF14476.1 efflux RND transporter periplasmic adaptor subunit [Alginatibacterium sediminis]
MNSLFGYTHQLFIRTFVSMLALLLSVSYAQANIEVHTVNTSQTHQRIVLDGSIEAIDGATLSAQTSGVVQELLFDINDFVQEGELLLKISNEEQAASLASAQAQLARANASNTQAQLNWQRLKKLFPKGAVSQGSLDQARAEALNARSAVDAANAGIVQAQKAVSYTEIKAPFSGIVTQRHVEIGEAISPGQALYSGLSLSKMRVITDVPQRHLALLQNSESIQVQLDDGSLLSSEDFKVFSYADTNSHTFKLRINFDNVDLKLIPGTWVKVRLQGPVREQILIPQSATLERNQLSAVYRIEDQKALLTQVRLGALVGNQITVLSGLMPNDVIALSAYAVLNQDKE